MTVNLTEMSKSVHQYAKEKGWWEKPRSDREVVMLMVTELAEATECVRNSEPHHHYGAVEKNNDLKCQEVKGKKFLLEPWKEMNHLKPEGEAVELVDCQIRILDFLGKREFDAQECVENTTVPGFKESHKDYELKLYKMSPLERHLEITNHLLKGIRQSEQEGDDGDDVLELFLCDALHTVTMIFQLEGWNWKEIIEEKMAFNQKRPYRHGGKAH